MPCRSSATSFCVNSMSSDSSNFFNSSTCSGDPGCRAFTRSMTSLRSSKSRRKECAELLTKLIGLFNSCAIPAVN